MRWLVLVLAMAHVAAAEPRTCKPAGGVLFEIQQRAVKGARLVTATTRLYGSGGWRTEVIDVDGKVARSEAGCLETSELDEVRGELARAEWRTTKSDTHCRADQPRFTRYIWRGRLVYTERTCNAVVLDPVSRHALDEVAFAVGAPVDLDGARVPTRSALPIECLHDPLGPGCN